MITHNSRIVVTGGNGFLGKFVVRELKKRGYQEIIIPPSKTYDLRIAANCRKVAMLGDIVIHLAATVGGIGFNRNYPATLFYDNSVLALHMLHESYKAGVHKFIGIGTVCAYPKYTPVPFSESSLWDGYPEETNAPYGLAKKMLLVGSQAYRQQYNFNSIYLIPVNLYGPGDNFNPLRSHVIPALISKIYHSKKTRQNTVTIWGSGNATREFLYVKDAAHAIILAMEKYNSPDPVNIGSGREISIASLVEKISKLIGYSGKILWDKSKPDGQPKRMLDVRKAYKEFGFRSTTDFDNGLKKTIDWYIKNYDK